MRKILVVVAAFAGLSLKCFDEPVVIAGTLTDCFIPGKDPAVGISGLDVRAFNPVGNGGLLAVLRSLDTLSVVMDRDSATAVRWDSEYWQLEELWGKATALALDSTSTTGSFSLTVPAMDSVLLLSLNQVEDQPSYYEYRMLGARSNVAVAIDMSGGACGQTIKVPSGG